MNGPYSGQASWWSLLLHVWATAEGHPGISGLWEILLAFSYKGLGQHSQEEWAGRRVQCQVPGLFIHGSPGAAGWCPGKSAYLFGMALCS
jgi:hypothetical protein